MRETTTERQGDRERQRERAGGRGRKGGIVENSQHSPELSVCFVFVTVFLLLFAFTFSVRCEVWVTLVSSNRTIFLLYYIYIIYITGFSRDLISARLYTIHCYRTFAVINFYFVIYLRSSYLLNRRVDIIAINLFICGWY